jgi:hypothetical protein
MGMSAVAIILLVIVVILLVGSLMLYVKIKSNPTIISVLIKLLVILVVIIGAFILFSQNVKTNCFCETHREGDDCDFYAPGSTECEQMKHARETVREWTERISTAMSHIPSVIFPKKVRKLLLLDPDIVSNLGKQVIKVPGVFEIADTISGEIKKTCKAIDWIPV